MQGRTALITGGARRIGRETALALAQQGASVVIHFHHSEREAQALAGELERLGVTAWTLRADLCDPGDRGTLIERARALAGGLDILVNNASIFPAEPFNELTWRQLSLDMEVNAWAPLAFSRDFARGIARGSIINLQDTHLEGYDLEHAGYILSKHVLAALTRMMALALAPAVTVNAVAPGLILPPPGRDERYLDSQAPRLPLQRHGGPRDIAEAIVFLIRSDFITGQVIYVDGGRHLNAYRRESEPKG
ncbi:MAG: SDR family oxidoreductase [Steroidobacteraceae bacterium]